MEYLAKLMSHIGDELLTSADVLQVIQRLQHMNPDNPTLLLTEAARNLSDQLSSLQSNAAPKLHDILESTDKLTGIRQRLHARLITATTLEREPTNQMIREDFAQDVRRNLKAVTAVQDGLQITNSIAALEPQVEKITLAFNDRDRTAQLFNEKVSLLRSELNEAANKEIPPTFLALKNQTVEQLTSNIIRAIPIPPSRDDDIEILLFSLIFGAHSEPSIKLILDDIKIQENQKIIFQISDAQDFRDYTAATFSPLLRQALMGKDAEVYDPLFRNCYFAVVQYLMKYYREHAEELKAQAAKLEEQQAGMQNATKSMQGATAATNTTSEPVANETLLELAQEPSASAQIPINGRMGAVEPISTEVQPPVDMPPAQPTSVAPVEPAQPIPVDKQTSKIKPLNLS